MKKILSLLVLSLVVSGCAQQTFTMSAEENETTLKESQHFFINGLGQDKEIDAAAVCNGTDKVAKVEVQETFVNGLLRTITLGIYTPREARVFCKS